MRRLKVIPAVADICSHLTGQRRQPGGELVTKEGKLGEYSRTPITGYRQRLRSRVQIKGGKHLAWTLTTLSPDN